MSPKYSELYYSKKIVNFKSFHITAQVLNTFAKNIVSLRASRFNYVVRRIFILLI